MAGKKKKGGSSGGGGGGVAPRGLVAPRRRCKARRGAVASGMT